MKSKRILALMLALVMTLSLAACGGSKQEEAPTCLLYTSPSPRD